jgi:hypothetical protein
MISCQQGLSGSDGTRMTHSCKLENLCGKIFEDSSNVYGSLGSNAHLILSVVLQETLDATARELKTNSC